MQSNSTHLNVWNCSMRTTAKHNEVRMYCLFSCHTFLPVLWTCRAHGAARSIKCFMFSLKSNKLMIMLVTLYNCSDLGLGLTLGLGLGRANGGARSIPQKFHPEATLIPVPVPVPSLSDSPLSIKGHDGQTFLKAIKILEPFLTFQKIFSETIPHFWYIKSNKE